MVPQFYGAHFGLLNTSFSDAFLKYDCRFRYGQEYPRMLGRVLFDNLNLLARF